MLPLALTIDVAFNQVVVSSWRFPLPLVVWWKNRRGKTKLSTAIEVERMASQRRRDELIAHHGIHLLIGATFRPWVDDVNFAVCLETREDALNELVGVNGGCACPGDHRRQHDEGDSPSLNPRCHSTRLILLPFFNPIESLSNQHTIYYVYVCVSEK